MANKVIFNEFYDINKMLTPLQQNLIKILESSGPLTRKELVQILKTPRTTIYDNLLKLQKRKIVEKFSRNEGKRGRPKVFWKVNK
ncbi:MAG: hypothetical protein ACTSVV_16530 [Promethearchaeota archaeon]